MFGPRAVVSLAWADVADRYAWAFELTIAVYGSIRYWLIATREASFAPTRANRSRILRAVSVVALAVLLVTSGRLLVMGTLPLAMSWSQPHDMTEETRLVGVSDPGRGPNGWRLEGSYFLVREISKIPTRLLECPQIGATMVIKGRGRDGFAMFVETVEITDPRFDQPLVVDLRHSPPNLPALCDAS
ncbi:MAG: hypothetical protein AAF700_08210 [Pseudomonadota bacterium]